MASLEDLQDAALKLRAAFPPDSAERELLFAPESPGQWSLELKPISVARLRQLQSELFPSLLRAGFNVKLIFHLFGSEVERRVESGPGGPSIRAAAGFPKPVDGAKNKILPLYFELEEVLCSATRVNKVLDLLDRVESPSEDTDQASPESSTSGDQPAEPPQPQTFAEALGVDLGLSLSLAKTADILPRLDLEVDEEAIHLLAFLFPESLAARLAVESFENLEKDYFKVGKRTVFLVFGAKGRLEAYAGDPGPKCGGTWRQPPGLVAVYGWNKATDITNAGLPPEMRDVQKTCIKRTLRFRNRHSLWPRGTTWLVPEALELQDLDGHDSGELAPVGQELRKLQVLLALIFLATETRSRGEGSFELLFGRGQRHGVVVSQSVLDSYEKHFTEILELYDFGFQDRKVEKLDILRQTLQNWVRDTASIFETAVRALSAAEQIHENYVGEHVAEYFLARRQTQDYIQSVVRDMEASTVDLSGSVAENVYKTVGVLAAAALAGLLKPELALLAAVGALVIAAYVCLVLFYYLPTVDNTWEIRRSQFRDHIRSFTDVLGSEKAEELVQNDRVQAAEAQFSRTRQWATAIYMVVLTLALGAVAYLVS